ncbi:hypothetical protein GCM10020001_119650 [Nonomuraea salmonea]
MRRSGWGGFPLDHPGDPKGPAYLVVQCRCTTLYLDEDELDAEQRARLATRDPDGPVSASSALDADAPDAGGDVAADTGPGSPPAPGPAPGPAPAAQPAPEPVPEPEPEPEQDPGPAPAPGAHAAMSTTGPGGPVTAAGGETDMSTPDQLPNGWRGAMGALDVETGDSRILAMPPDGLRTREGTIVLMWQESTSVGHDGSVLVGRADKVWTEEVDGVTYVMGEGPLDTEGEHGREAARLMHNGLLTGISIDPDDITVEWQFRDQDGNEINVAAMDEYEFWEKLDSGEITEVMVMTDWRLMGGTLVPFPAYDQARIEPVYDYASPTTSDGDDDAGDDDASSGDSGDGGDGGDGEGLAASAAADVTVYTAADFADPRLSGPTPLTVTQDGRVTGHLAVWGTCHVGIGDVCVTPPKSRTDYAYFHVGAVRLEDGASLPVGTITLGTGHADPKLGYQAAAAHYDDTGAQVAVVRAGEDEHGIWVSGRVLGHVTAAQVEELMRSPLSGDWRSIGGNLELVAALAVNRPGFPVLRSMAASSAGQQMSLVAAGYVRRRPRRPGSGPAIDYARLAQMVAREVAAQNARTARAQKLARRIGRDPYSRAATVAARIGR